ncbi:NADH dehydrogenase [ubiquinone] 1 alpha subcomplex subunit 9 [Pyrus ussuriensis x Pyrus communis]|uniref:NADH dehydrogenase [ubiquinone] 1 alpha subcomplex subunit 9 n=1 Tax=Pyrus ussuriensis x Pyrus communis TaxID=2448454 RepID=A0A5N5FZU8_9ROSA|nr:NADH dehydrogenase [ubiquinone] 1 alpha subcomplex subunit 9 [Pyrus ussuriensis x Pyrus communis]
MVYIYLLSSFKFIIVVRVGFLLEKNILLWVLSKMGSQVLVPFCGFEDSHRHLKLMGDLGQIVPMKYNPRDEDSIKAVMAKANVTRNFSFEEMNHFMAQQLAMVLMRFIQVSCLGASSSSPSRFLRTKVVAEEAVLSELPEVERSRKICRRGWQGHHGPGMCLGCVSLKLN